MTNLPNQTRPKLKFLIFVSLIRNLPGLTRVKFLTNQLVENSIQQLMNQFTATTWQCTYEDIKNIHNYFFKRIMIKIRKDSNSPSTSSFKYGKRGLRQKRV
ncbi:hypothetical protein ACP275_14G065100 [Erythranthe tilingii]